jgi:rhamnogalacturonyl hydrolase YesR
VYDENNKSHYDYNEKGGKWTHGMFTGCYLLAYDLTKDEKYLDVAREHMKVYEEVAADRMFRLRDHDVD